MGVQMHSVCVRLFIVVLFLFPLLCSKNTLIFNGTKINNRKKIKPYKKNLEMMYFAE